MIHPRIIIRDQKQRNYAKQVIDTLPENTVITFAEKTRTLEQNALMWSRLGDLEKAKPEGREHSAEQWKGIFMEAIGIKQDFVPNLDGDAFICLGSRSSYMKVSEMSDMIECINAYGARFDVEWSLAV